jgi:ribosome-associated protein
MRVDEEKAKAFDELTRQAAFIAVSTAEDRKAEDVKLFDVSKTSIIADYYMICTGFSDPHLKAISSNIQKALKEHCDLTVKRAEGAPESQWILLNFPNLVVHILHPDGREKYKLEKLWESGIQIFPEITDGEESSENSE